MFIVLKTYGLPDVFVNVLKSLYENVTVKLSVGEAGDVHVPSTIGVLQGSHLSPTVFIMFMQAMMETTQKKIKRFKPIFSTTKDGVIVGRGSILGGQLVIRWPSFIRVSLLTLMIALFFLRAPTRPRKR